MGRGTFMTGANWIKPISRKSLGVVQVTPERRGGGASSSRENVQKDVRDHESVVQQKPQIPRAAACKQTIIGSHHA